MLRSDVLTREIKNLLDEIQILEKSNPIPPWTLTREELVDGADKLRGDWCKRDYALTEIFDANTPIQLNEASLGFLYSCFTCSKSDSFAIIPDISRIEKRRNKEKTVRIIDKFSDYEFSQLLAHSQSDDPANQKKILEIYWFIVGPSLSILLDTAKFFESYLFLYSGPETDGGVSCFYDSGLIEDIGEFHPTRIAHFFSKFTGKATVFEMRVPTWFGGYAALKHGVKAVAGIRRSKKFVSKTVRHIS